MVIATRSVPGIRLTRQRITPGDTSSAIAAATLRTQGRWKVHATSLGTYVLKKGDTIAGATSASTIHCEAVVLESGSFAGGDGAGWIYGNGRSAAFQAENIDVGSNSNVGTIDGDFIDIVADGLQAKRAVVRCMDNDIRYDVTGSAPTATSGTNPCTLLYAGQEIALEDMTEMENFRFIDAVSGSASNEIVECFF